MLQVTSARCLAPYSGIRSSSLIWAWLRAGLTYQISWFHSVRHVAVFAMFAVSLYRNVALSPCPQRRENAQVHKNSRISQNLQTVRTCWLKRGCNGLFEYRNCARVVKMRWAWGLRRRENTKYAKFATLRKLERCGMTQGTGQQKVRYNARYSITQG